MKWPRLAIVRRHTERGPDAAGATSASLLPRRPRRGQAAAPLAFSGADRKLRFRSVLGKRPLRGSTHAGRARMLLWGRAVVAGPRLAEACGVRQAREFASD